MLRGKWGMWQLEYAQCTWTRGLRELHFGCYQKVLYLHWAIALCFHHFSTVQFALHRVSENVHFAMHGGGCTIAQRRVLVHQAGAGTGAPSCGKWAIMCIWQYLGNPFTLLPRVARSQDWRAPEISLKDIFCEKTFWKVTGELTDLKATLGNVQSSLTSSLASIQGDISWI